MKIAADIEDVEPFKYPSWKGIRDLEGNDSSPLFIPMRRKLRLHFDP